MKQSEKELKFWQEVARLRQEIFGSSELEAQSWTAVVFDRITPLRDLEFAGGTTILNDMTDDEKSLFQESVEFRAKTLGMSKGEAMDWALTDMFRIRSIEEATTEAITERESVAVTRIRFDERDQGAGFGAIFKATIADGAGAFSRLPDNNYLVRPGHLQVIKEMKIPFTLVE